MQIVAMNWLHSSLFPKREIATGLANVHFLRKNILEII